MPCVGQQYVYLYLQGLEVLLSKVLMPCVGQQYVYPVLPSFLARVARVNALCRATVCLPPVPGNPVFRPSRRSICGAKLIWPKKLVRNPSDTPTTQVFPISAENCASTIPIKPAHLPINLSQKPLNRQREKSEIPRAPGETIPIQPMKRLSCPACARRWQSWQSVTILSTLAAPPY